MNDKKDLTKDNPLMKALDHYKADEAELDVYQMGMLTRKHQELYPVRKAHSFTMIAIGSVFAAGLAAMGMVALVMWLGSPEEVHPSPEIALEDTWIPLSAFSLNAEPGELNNEPFSDLHARISNYRMVDQYSGHQFLMNRNESLNERLGAMKLNMFSDETL